MAVGTYALITLEDYKSWARIGSTELEADALSLYSDDGTAATVAKSGNLLTLAKTVGTGTGHSIPLNGGTPVVVTDITNGVCTTAETEGLKVGDLIIFTGDAAVDGSTYEITALTNDTDFTIDDLTVNPGAVVATTCILDCTTLSKLAILINHHTGWTANLEGWASAPSTDLRNFAAVDCLLVNNEQTLIFYENYILERLIDRGSSIIESFLRRNIKSRAYTNERYDGGGGEIFLKNYPVTELIHVCNTVEDVIRVKCDSITARHAYVAVDAVAQTVKMVRDGTVDATHDLSAVLTILALATAMNAVSGWTAQIISTVFNAWLTSDLISNPSMACALRLGWPWAELQVPDEPLEGLEVDMEAGIIQIPTVEGFLNVYVSFTGGYVAVPYDLISATCEFVQYLDNLRERDQSLKDEKHGMEYTWSAVDLEKALSPENMKTLRKYQRPLI